jgi:FkbM family methyltransferase
MLKAAVEVVKVVWDHPANKRNRPFALAKAVAWQAVKRALPGPLTIKTAEGYKFVCYADSQDAGRMIYFNGRPDPTEMLFLDKYLRPGDCVLDVGANVGTYTLFAAQKVGPAGRVFAVEPDPTNMQRLQENCRINSFFQVQFFEGALGDMDRDVEFTVGRDTANHLTFSTGRPSRTVKMRSIDTLAPDLKFDVVKIDAEGAEALIMKGAAAATANGRVSVLLMEMVDRFLVRAGSSLMELRAMIDQMGYQIFSYESGHLEPWERKDRIPGQIGDAVLVHQSALASVRARLA